MKLTEKSLEKYGVDFKVSQEKLIGGIHEALKKIDTNLKVFIDNYPKAASVNNIYPSMKNGEEVDDWTSGFWTGMLWLSYELTYDEKYRKLAEYQLRSFK